jgi:hypothetical protein
MMQAVFRPRQASQGLLFLLLHVLDPPNSDRTLKAGPRQADGSTSADDGDAIEGTRLGVEEAVSALSVTLDEDEFGEGEMTDEVKGGASASSAVSACICSR